MPDPISDAWVAIVLAEAATSYAYASAGPLLQPGQRTTAAQWYDEHERARDDALLALTSAGASPIAIPPFFALPEPLDGPVNARALLATVESRLALSYADLVSVLPLANRQRGIEGVLLANKRALTWGATNGAWGAQTPETAEAAG